MKTGRPEYYLPSARTVSRDVKEVFKKARSQIAKILQVRVLVRMIRPLNKTDLPARNMTVPSALRQTHGHHLITRPILL